MAALALQRCWNHGEREAVARCLECTHFYCRECITEHDERILCAACLKRLAAKTSAERRSFAPLARLAAAAIGFIAAWLFFFFIGRALVGVPTRFHEGTLWKSALDSALEKEETP